MADNKYLEEVKRSIEITDNNEELDQQLTDFINRVEQQLKARLGFIKEIPQELEYIVIEASISRFNRKGDEGMSSYSQEGESISYSSILDEFKDDIAAWLEQEKKASAPRRGVAFFL